MNEISKLVTITNAIKSLSLVFFILFLFSFNIFKSRKSFKNCKDFLKKL